MFRALSLGLVISMWVAVTTAAKADGPAAPLPKLGKYAMVFYVADNKTEAIPVVRPEFQTVGTKTFVTGVAMKLKGVTMFGAGQPVWINLDTIRIMDQFDSPEEMSKLAQESRPGKDN